ncbi:MAG TPA: ribbon-helix-helix protein, CopG family [Acidobacteriota bacterium]|jgi:hypothetical protein|nr:ribbon-helix-helix protein, CopG family [Acidobacteriota bacterium]
MMTLSVRLDAETEQLVERMARQRDQTKSEVIRDAIAALAPKERRGKGAKGPFGRAADLIGCVRGGPSDLSVRTGEKFRQILTSRARA